MSNSLAATKHRILSIENTEKTTKAMELIAMAKMKKLRDAYDKSRLYYAEYLDFMGLLFKTDAGSKSHYCRLNKESASTLHLVVSSNMGLCGAYNANLFRYADSLIGEKDAIAPIGLKAMRHYERGERFANIIGDYAHLNSHLDPHGVSQVALELKNLFNAKRFRAIDVIYTRYVNSISFQPMAFRLLPVCPSHAPWKNESFAPPLFEENPHALIHSLLPEYLGSLLYMMLLESELSEQASRRVAMDNANDNADELLEKLHIEYNKARQGAITQELTELIGGSEAQK